MIIRFVLLAAAFILLAWYIKRQSSVQAQALNRLGALILFALAVVAVLFPGSTNTVAHAVGVGRGADLLLYGLTALFFASVIKDYFGRRDTRTQTYRLARRMAILEANLDERNQKYLPSLKNPSVGRGRGKSRT